MVALMLAMWLLVGGFGVSVGMHRHFAHRAFSAPKWVRVALAMAGSMAAQGPVSYWVGIHRRHHTFSDEPGDPHSPHRAANGARSRLWAFLHGHVGWAISHDVPMPSRYSADLIRDPAIAWVDRRYWWLVGAGIVIPAMIGLAMHGGSEGFFLGAYWGASFASRRPQRDLVVNRSACRLRRPSTDRQVSQLSLLSILSLAKAGTTITTRRTLAKFAHHWADRYRLDIIKSCARCACRQCEVLAHMRACGEDARRRTAAWKGGTRRRLYPIDSAALNARLHGVAGDGPFRFGDAIARTIASGAVWCSSFPCQEPIIRCPELCAVCGLTSI